MKWRSYLLLLSASVALASCATQRAEQAAPPSASPPPATGFKRPTVPATQPTPAVAGLVQPTNAKVRLPSIAKGRSDPFAQLDPGLLPASVRAPVAVVPKPASAPLSLPIAPPPPPLPVNPSAPARSKLPPFASVPLAAPPQQPNAVPPSTAALPPITGPVTPVSPTALADAIAVTGAVQLQNQWVVIVKEPDSTSRYVKTGDRLANGQVLVKRVSVGPGGDPTVVFQQNGREVIKAMGAGDRAVASAPARS